MHNLWKFHKTVFCSHENVYTFSPLLLETSYFTHPSALTQSYDTPSRISAYVRYYESAIAQQAALNELSGYRCVYRGFDSPWTLTIIKMVTGYNIKMKFGYCANNHP